MPDFAFTRTFPECHCRIRLKSFKAAWWNSSHEHIRRAAWLDQVTSFWSCRASCRDKHIPGYHCLNCGHGKPKHHENLYLELD